MPGGRINSNDFNNELIREVKEETGLDIKVDRFVDDWSFTRNNGDVTNCKIYSCSTLSYALTAKDSENYENIEKFIWLTAEEIENKKFEIDNKLRNIILKELRA